MAEGFDIFISKKMLFSVFRITEMTVRKLSACEEDTYHMCPFEQS